LGFKVSELSAAEQYARWVLEPENVLKTGHLMKLSAKRFISDLEREDIYFYEDQANLPIIFIEENLNHWEDKWRGQPVMLEPWQKFIIQQVYGWIVVETGLRRVKMAFIETGKKNAKTAMAAFFSLFHLFADRINAPKVFVGATNHEQANICVNYAGKTIENSPVLADYIEDDTVKLSKYNGKILTITHEERDGFIETMAKEPEDQTKRTAGGKHGKNPSLVIIDEYAMADSDSLLNAMENAQGAREEPLTVCITTSGPKKQGPCYTKLRKTGIDIMEGTIEDDTYLAFIFEMDRPIGEDGKPFELTIGYLMDHPEIYQQSNPNYKVSVYDHFLKSQLTKAKNEGGTKEVDVLTFNFNMWVDSPTTFISAETWNANAHGTDEDELEGQVCYGGIELVGAKGLSAFVLVFPGDIVRVKVFFWMPREYINNNPDKFDGYGKWLDYIKVDEGNTVENSMVIDWLSEEIGKYYMHSFAFPKIKENNDIVQGLIKMGIVGNPLSQTVGGIGDPTSQWEDLLTAHKVEHFNNPVLTWMNGNCNVIRKESGIRIEKSESRVVGISAAISAIAQWKTIETEGGGDIGILYI